MKALARWSGLFAGMSLAVAAAMAPAAGRADGEGVARTEAPRRIAFWPDAVPAAIQQHSDGAAVLAAVKALGKHHRVQGSPGLYAAAKWVEGELLRAGYKGVTIERLPADGATSYGHFKSYYGWTAELGKLEQLTPTKRVLADYAASPVALADYSQDADVTAELVDVGSGADAAAYQGKDVRGKIALADGPLPVVHRLAVEERGAAGFVSVFPNQHTAWSGLDPDLVRWGHLSPYQRANRFAFMISPRQAAALRQELGRGAVRLSAKVKAKMVAASYDIVSATIAGSDAAAGEIVLTAHLCHQLAGANDNASGSAALLGVARALQAAIAAGALPQPTRTLRFLWVPEMTGSQAWLVRHPELAGRLRAGIHLDMVGGRPEVTHSALHLSRSAASLPHAINEISRAWVADVARISTVFAESGEGDGMIAPGGGRDALVTDLRPLELGSDHQIFEAFGVPMVYFHDWPDVTIHTNKDVPENLDATKLGRVTYMTAGIAWTLAALPDAEAARLPALSRASTDESLALARRAALTGGYSAEDARLGQREALTMGLEELASIGALWPSAKLAVQKERASLSKALASLPPAPAAPRASSAPGAAPARDRRVPTRTPATRGPLNVYYYNHLAAVFGPTSVPPAALLQRSDVFSYEALNLVDGKRTISDIRDLLAGRYAPVPTAEIAEWLEVLAKAGVVSLATPGKGR